MAHHLVATTNLTTSDLFVLPYGKWMVLPPIGKLNRVIVSISQIRPAQISLT